MDVNFKSNKTLNSRFVIKYSKMDQIKYRYRKISAIDRDRLLPFSDRKSDGSLLQSITKNFLYL